MNWYEKIKSTVSPNDKIHVSTSNNIVFKDQSSNQAVYPKPKGLWYACGLEWINFMLNELSEPVEDKYLFKIEINPSVLTINNDKSLDEFNNEYGTSIYGIDIINAINWPEVAKKWSGIEICPRRYPKNPLSTWYYGWDVASGCVWNKNGIAKIEKYI